MKWIFEKFKGDMAVYAICPRCGFYHCASSLNPDMTTTITNQYKLCPMCGEYLYVEGILEKVGAWDVNLEDYVTATDFEIALNNKVDVIPDYELMSPEEKAKLAGIESHA